MQDINSSNIQKLESMISQARKIAVVTHQKPDGDAMGSCTALYHFLSLCGKGPGLLSCEIHQSAKGLVQFIRVIS